MNPETLFQIANVAVVPGWLLLLFAPRWRYGAACIAGVLLPAGVAILYTALLIGGLPFDGGFDSLEAIGRLFDDPWLRLAGWVHYLAFDLFVGAWEVRDARRHGIPHLLVVPCLVFTFLSGPFGLLLYLVIRNLRLRRVFIGEKADA